MHVTLCLKTENPTERKPFLKIVNETYHTSFISLPKSDTLKITETETKEADKWEIDRGDLVERYCVNCSETHPTIIYKRLTSPGTINFRKLFLDVWESYPQGGQNLIDGDFALYRSRDDAKVQLYSHLHTHAHTHKHAYTHTHTHTHNMYCPASVCTQVDVNRLSSEILGKIMEKDKFMIWRRGRGWLVVELIERDIR